MRATCAVSGTVCGVDADDDDDDASIVFSDRVVLDFGGLTAAKRKGKGKGKGEGGRGRGRVTVLTQAPMCT